MSYIAPIVTAILGFVGGLLTPLVKWKVEELKIKRSEQATAIKEWRKEIDDFDFENESYGTTPWYSSLRAHMRADIIEKLERERVVFVPGPRGGPVEKHILLDEVSRLEKIMWKLQDKD